MKNDNLPYTPVEIMEIAIVESSKGNNPFKQIGENQGFGYYGKSILNDNTPKPYLELINMVCEYVNQGIYPCVKGEQRDKFFIERLNKFKIRYVGDL